MAKEINEIQVEYYRQRAGEYDRLYENPDRQKDLKGLSELLKPLVAGQQVLEIACGTGFWTQVMAQSAAQIWATDINHEMLEVARSKNYSQGRVQFEQKNLYDLEPPQKPFDSLFGGFIWSHILLQDLRQFVQHCLRSWPTFFQPVHCLWW